MTYQKEAVIIDALVHEETVELRRRLATLEAFVGGSSTRTAYTYRVEIKSNWPGEITTTTQGTGSLYVVMRLASDEYMRENRRKDVQGNYRVWVVLGPDGSVVELPLSFWEDVTLQIRREQMAKYQPSKLAFCTQNGLPI